jgi:hypothetical protein
MWNHLSRTSRRTRRSCLFAALTLVAACSVVVTGPGVFIIVGTWGGEHLQLDLTEQGGTLEYDCAHGTIDAGWTITDDGEFEGSGEHIIEHGGPVQDGEILPTRPASYTGTVRDDRMSLTVTLSDSAQVVGTFDLVHGSDGQLLRCL